VLAYDDAIQDWIFPAPGRPRLAVEYEDSDTGVIRSSPVAIKVIAPRGDEKTIHDAIRSIPGAGPRFLSHLDSPGRYFATKAASSFGPNYRTSVYLQGPRQRDLDYRLSDISDRENPDDPTSAPSSDPNRRRELVRQRRLELLSEAEEIAQDLCGGQFEPDALVTLASLYVDAGNDAHAREIYQRVAREFPDRRTAIAARQVMSDMSRPAELDRR
jgi:hypothetical protein